MSRYTFSLFVPRLYICDAYLQPIHGQLEHELLDQDGVVGFSQCPPRWLIFASQSSSGGPQVNYDRFRPKTKREPFRTHTMATISPRWYACRERIENLSKRPKSLHRDESGLRVG